MTKPEDTLIAWAMTQQDQLSKRDQNLAIIREKAIPIAERIILEEGLYALSARGLAKEIGVSVGSLYNAFGDLDAVLRAVIERATRMLSGSLHTAVEQSVPEAQARVISLGEAYLDFALAEPQRWWLLFEYNSNKPTEPTAKEFQLDLLEMLVQAGDGNPASEQDREFFVLLWASIHGLVTLARRPTIVAVDPQAARSYIANLVDAGFRSFSTANDGRRNPT